jgi:nucleoside-diphosphate-sugar epimerase
LKVFVTGSSGHLAQALVPALCAHPGIEAVTGLDLRAPRYAHPRFTAHVGDLRARDLASRLAGHDALIHLAFVVLRGRRSEPEMFDVNVRGSHHLFHAARAAGIRRLIHLSSAAVYGEGVHLREDAPHAPLPGFLYGHHKAQLERILEIEFPECVRLRPHVILGTHAQPLLRALLRQPFYPRLAGPQPLLQCVHEDDVAQAVLLALDSNARGAFNLATDDSFTFGDALRARHGFAVPLPPAVGRRMLYFAWRCFGWGGEPAWIDGLTRPLLLNCRRAIVELGWRSTRSAAKILPEI